uniref:C2H2-type domain-containing protein n=1 Tax=Parastrongyloides trichosuri TaxID=131310 RepID=A0A0N4ZI15_PARTI
MILNLTMASHDDCKFEGKSYDLRYSLPSNRNIKGVRFSCKYMPYLKNFKLLDKRDFVDLTKRKMPHPRVVTAFSNNHKDEAGRLLKSFRDHFPGQKIIVYDLGLSYDAVKKLKKMCYVEYRKFDFKKYPKHVSIIKTYAFKILIAAEVLRDYGSVFWADASVRFKKTNLNYVYDLLNCYVGKDHDHRVKEQKLIGNGVRRNSYKNIFRHEKCKGCYWHFRYKGFDKNVYNFNVKHCHKSPIMFHVPTFHGILPTLHNDVYKYFPTEKERYGNHSISREYDAAFSLMVKTEDAVNDVLKWAVLCALDKHCIQPVAWFRCGGHFRRDNIFSKKHICYRFDQSILSVLLHNANNYDLRNYVSEIHDFASIERTEMLHWKHLKNTCKKS